MARTTLKSNSTKGGNGFNEMRFDDTKGAEQLFFHAERNLDTWVKHDALTRIGHERHVIVEKNDFARCGGDRSDALARQSQRAHRRQVLARCRRRHAAQDRGESRAQRRAERRHQGSGQRDHRSRQHAHAQGGRQHHRARAAGIAINAAGPVTIDGVLVKINCGGAGGGVQRDERAARCARRSATSRRRFAMNAPAEHYAHHAHEEDTMRMTLAVRTYQGAAPDAPLACGFGTAGGTIGRGPDNTMVLPDALENGVARACAHRLERGRLAARRPRQQSEPAQRPADCERTARADREWRPAGDRWLRIEVATIERRGARQASKRRPACMTGALRSAGRRLGRPRSSGDPLANAAVLAGSPLPGALFDPLGAPLGAGSRHARQPDGRAAFIGSENDHVPPEQFALVPDAAVRPAAFPTTTIRCATRRSRCRAGNGGRGHHA